MLKTTNEDGSETIDHDIGSYSSTDHSKSGISDEASLKIYDHYNDSGLPSELYDLPGTAMAGFEYSVEGKERMLFDDVRLKETKVADHANEIKTTMTHEMDIPVMLTPVLVILTPLRRPGF